jgi:dTDP-glucose pyrophosphorylase
MRNWKEFSVSPGISILKAIEVIDRGAIQTALIVNEQGKLLGTLTDGDIRRAILKRVSLDSPVEQIMNKRPVTASVKEDRQKVLGKMRSKDLRRIPVLDEQGRVTGLEVLEELVLAAKKDNWVMLMAGGLGSRLRPLTESMPKPLVQIGDKPLLETVLSSFVEQGFHKFYFSVNYKAEMIQSHFGDGSKWGVEIRYVHENEPLGTAGALRLLPEPPSLPIVVMNGDLLTKVNFENLVDFHTQKKALATMCIREYDFQVPYGVVRLEKEKIVNIDEKPMQKFFVNAGIYVLDPSVVRMIPEGKFFNMTDLFDRLIQEKKEVDAFPVREYWLDIGKIADLERANGEYDKVFK